MENTTVEVPGTVALEPPSTVLNPETVKTVSGGGQTPLREAEGSISSVLTAELAKLRAEDDAKAKPVEDDEKPVKEAKAEKPVAEKPAKEVAAKEPSPTPKGEPETASGEPAKPAVGQEAAERSRQSEGREYKAPPARLLPASKELWSMVPNALKGDIHRLIKDHETEKEQYRAAHEAYESIKDFDEMAKRGNTNLRTALERYTGLEQMLRTNPVQGVAEVLRNIGVTPIQFAQHILNNPQLHEYKPAPQQPAQQPARSPEIDQLRAEITAMRHEAVARDIIGPFREANPRYDELQEDIAFFLQSGKIPTSLSPVERLEAAYDMAARINPSGNMSSDRQEPAAITQPYSDSVSPKPAGTRSIRGAPADGADTAIPEGKSSVRDILRKEMRKMSA